jgi:hypothetical protein
MRALLIGVATGIGAAAVSSLNVAGYGILELL